MGQVLAELAEKVGLLPSFSVFHVYSTDSHLQLLGVVAVTRQRGHVREIEQLCDRCVCFPARMSRSIFPVRPCSGCCSYGNCCASLPPLMVAITSSSEAVRTVVHVCAVQLSSSACLAGLARPSSEAPGRAGSGAMCTPTGTISQRPAGCRGHPRIQSPHHVGSSSGSLVGIFMRVVAFKTTGLPCFSGSRCQE
mmetsp:Transcript_57003/g.104468  ORF Transcript_57003/g.104468 Transcript_57003/m.104468 type:complete len:194 (-) Transcript_57003:266-847(-)